MKKGDGESVDGGMVLCLLAAGPSFGSPPSGPLLRFELGD